MRSWWAYVGVAAAVLPTGASHASVGLAEAAGPLGLAGVERDRAIQCMAQAISYEAGHEPEAGQQAVAQVILNRLRDPAFPKSICGVVFQGSERRTGCQFTFTCDGAMTRWKPGATWAGAVRIATLAIDGGLAPSIGDAVNYHADYVQPGWAARLTRVGRIGAHIFYRAGRAAATTGASALPAGPRSATLSVWGLPTAVLTPVGGVVQVTR